MRPWPQVKLVPRRPAAPNSSGPHRCGRAQCPLHSLEIGERRGCPEDPMLDVLVLAQDIATAACGSFNALHFLGYWLGRDTARSRRVGAAALTVINAAVGVGSLFFLALYWTHRR